MMRWVSSVVRVMWQGSCGAVTAVVSDEKNSGSGIAVLDLKRVPVDRRPVEPRRGSGLEPREREAGAVQALGERDRGRIAEAAGGRSLVAEMDHAAQEGAGREDDRPAGERAAVGERDAGDGAGVGRDRGRFAFDDGQVRGRAR